MTYRRPLKRNQSEGEYSICRRRMAGAPYTFKASQISQPWCAKWMFGSPISWTRSRCMPEVQ